MLMMFVSLGTLQAQITDETLYISAQDYVNDLTSNPANWKTSRNSENDIVYVGEVRNGLPNGTGRLIQGDGLEIHSVFKNGKRDGVGILTYPDGRKVIVEYW